MQVGMTLSFQIHLAADNKGCFSVLRTAHESMVQTLEDLINDVFTPVNTLLGRY